MSAFRQAKPMQAYLKLGIYGASGSGKTFTSLLIAEGLASRDKREIAYIDTERGTDFYCQAIQDRKIHPEAFKFDAIYTKSVMETLEAAKSLDSKYSVLVIDSMTHLWEATKNAYDGPLTSNGSIPLHAWGPLKKPYKELITTIINGDFHTIICGRQGADFEEDSEGNLKSTGYKMKAESETPYETHVLIRMKSEKMKTGTSVPTAIIEKDRTGILSGKIISMPNYQNMVQPILKVLAGEQAKIEDESQVAIKDADAIAKKVENKKTGSKNLLDEYEGKIKVIKSDKELKDLSKDITKVKKQMVQDDIAALRKFYLEKETKLKGGS